MSPRGRFTRMGVINLYEYANEVFVFEDGKLVIKGANGVGKSRALELTYPLLLEGNIAEYRVDTTGKQGRPFAWNLSLGDVYTRRVGYTWLEAEMPGGEHVTIGMGASGGQSGGSQTTDSTWFFVLRGARILDPAREVGTIDLAPEGQPLNRRGLSGALGADGRTYTTAGDYRHAVNDALFGFASMDAYQSMVNLLFLLRRPKLAEVLNPEVFHEQLTASLPELDLSLVKEGADRLDMLERMRERIDGLRADREAALAFGGVYERYLQRLGHERASRLLEAERHRREAAQAQTELRAQQDELARAQAAHAEQAGEAEARRERLDGHRAALLHQLNSPGAQRLTEATAAAKAAERTHGALNGRVRDLRSDREELDGELRELTADTERASQQLLAAQSELETLLSESGVPVSAWPQEGLDAHVESVERDRRHRAQLLHRAAQLDADVDRSGDELDRAERHTAALVAALEGRQAEAQEAVEAAESARDAAEELVRWWAGDLTELTAGDEAVEQILAALETESGALDLTPVAAAHDEHRDRTQAQRAQTEHRIGLIAEERARVQDELDRLAEGLSGSPERAGWRSDVEGPALWELVDFGERLTARQRDGLEAALDASGLLTGVPVGEGVQAADGNLLLATGTAVSGRTLDDVLVVDPAAVGVDVDTLRGVLASVAVVERDAVAGKRGLIVLGLDGSCALGPIRARREVTPASWVGATARERGRVAREAELEARAEHLDGEREAEQRALETLDAAAERARFEASSLRGGDREYAAARSRRLAAEVAVEVARSSARVAEEEIAAVRAKGRDARLAASSFQREHDLPDRGGRQALVDALAELRSQLRELLAPAERLARSRRGLGAVQAKLAAKGEALIAAEREESVAEEERARLAGELEMVREIEGPQLLDVQAEFDSAERELKDVQATLRWLAGEQTTLTKRSGVIETQVEVVAGRVRGSVARFEAALEALNALATHGLAAIEEDGLRAAQALAAEPAPAETLTQLTARVSEQIAELREALSPSRGYVVSQEYPGDDRDLVVVTVASSYGRQRVEELAQQLGSELEALKASISESEQQLMRKWIVDGLADALAVRLAEVRDQVERTNRVLAGCRTHFGIRVGLKWEVESEAPEALRDTVELLGRGPGMLDAGAQTLLGARLQELIDAERDRGEGTTSEQIARALDYREWHRFWVLITRDGGPTRKLTNRQLVAGSGGERAIMLQLPLLAAVAGFFDGAALASPRALVLDEAFEGIDDAHARQMLEVLGELDLDFMMASYKLRPFVPNHRFALVNLRRFRSQRVVVGQRSVWTGSKLVPDD